MNNAALRAKLGNDPLSRAYAKAQARQAVKAVQTIRREAVLPKVVRLPDRTMDEYRKRAQARLVRVDLNGPKPMGKVCHEMRAGNAWPEEAGRLGWHEGRYSFGKPEHWHHH